MKFGKISPLELKEQIKQVFGDEYKLEEVEKVYQTLNLLNEEIENNTEHQEIISYPDDYFEGM